MTIHLTFDHPDLIDGKKTKAVKNLIASQHVHDHIVFSLNRTIFNLNILKTQREHHGYTLFIFGLPFGMLLFLWLFIAYRRIAKIIKNGNIKPDLIHAHKLTYEGLIAYFLSRKLKVPFVLTIRGDTDLKLLRYKRLYRRFYTHIVLQAKKVIFLAPWAVKPLERYLGITLISDKYTLIPNIINMVERQQGETIKFKKFITVFNFVSYKRKNIVRVIKAFDKIFSNYPEYGLDIVGDGPNRSRIISFIEKSKHPDHFHLTGAIEHSTLLNLYSKYQGFILPSFPETFGLVFIEALTAGLPIIYSKNSGIDGFFDDCQIGVGVNHQSVEEITRAIEEIIQHANDYKKNIEKLITDGFFEKFSKSSVGECYAKIIEQCSLT